MSVNTASIVSGNSGSFSSKVDKAVQSAEKARNSLHSVTNGIATYFKQATSSTGVFKDGLDVIKGAIQTVEAVKEEINLPEITAVLRDTVAILGFVELSRRIVFFMNVFEVGRIDRNLFKDELKKTVQAKLEGKEVAIEEEDFKIKIEAIVTEALKHKKWTRHLFKAQLVEIIALRFTELSKVECEELVKPLKVAMHSRAINLICSHSCKTVLNVRSCLRALDRFKAISTTKIHASMTKSAPVVLRLGEFALDLASKGLIFLNSIAIVVAVKQLIAAQKEINSTEVSAEERTQAYIRRKCALWDVALNVVMLASVIIPTIFMVSQTVSLVLELVANSTSVLHFLAKPS